MTGHIRNRGRFWIWYGGATIISSWSSDLANKSDLSYELFKLFVTEQLFGCSCDQMSNAKFAKLKGQIIRVLQ